MTYLRETTTTLQQRANTTSVTKTKVDESTSMRPYTRCNRSKILLSKKSRTNAASLAFLLSLKLSFSISLIFMFYKLNDKCCEIVY